jgi:hypothetical protein
MQRLRFVCLFIAGAILAQTTADPSGHWEGAFEIMPDREVKFDVDLVRKGNGELGGTIGIREENVKGLPLLKVSLNGNTIHFHARADQPFSGVLSADGKWVRGKFTIEGFSVPFSMTRTGDAQIETLPRSAAVRKEMEGTWNGTLEAEGRKFRLALKLANEPDGTATAKIVNLDQGGVEIPAVISQTGASLQLALKSIAGSYSAELNKEATELSGTFQQGGRTFALVFRKLP